MVIILFVALFMHGTNFSQLGHLHMQWGILFASVVAGLAFRYWAVIAWNVILQALGVRTLPPFGVMAHVFAQAWMARYVPGTVTMIAGKIFMASKYGISKSRLVVSSLLEGAMQIVAAVVVSLFLLGFSPYLHSIPMAIKALTVGVSILLLAILIPSIFNRLLGYAYRIVKRQKVTHAELHINGEAVIKSFILFAIGTFISGTASFLVVRSIIPHVSFGLYGYLVGAFGLAGAIGMAVPFVPSGLGVRDGVQLVLLSAVMSRDEALLIIVLARIWQIAVDGLFLGIAALIYRVHKSRYEVILSQLNT